jgi:hypothetical protein
MIRTLDKLGDRADRSEAVRYARRSGLRGGGLPIEDGLRLGLVAGFLTAHDDELALTDLGHRALGLGDSDDPSATAKEFLMSVIVLAEPPSWVAWWQGQPGSLDAVLPDTTRELLGESGLLPPPGLEDLARWGWWKALEEVRRARGRRPSARPSAMPVNR